MFAWQLSLPSDRASSPELQRLGVPESDEAVLEYGGVPYRLTHPGEDCAIAQKPGRPAEIVCEGTREYGAAAALGEQGTPFVPLDAPPWWVTVLTSMFMHGGLLHFGFNMLFLWIFGNNIEDSMGRARFLLFYLLAGAAAVYAQAMLDTGATQPTIGASGAIAGVLGGYILLHPGARILTLVFIIFFVTLIEIPAVIMLGIWFALQFIPAVGQLATPDVAASGGGIAYLAHVGGFVFGLLAIKLFANRRRGAAIAG